MSVEGNDRYVLVVASQCDAPELEELSFLPPRNWVSGDDLTPDQRLPAELYELLTDKTAGACIPVPDLAELAGDSLYEADSSLLVNPTLAQVSASVSHAFKAANDQQAAALLIYFVGHGTGVGSDEPGAEQHLLLVKDSSPFPQTDDDAWNPYGKIEQHHRNSSLAAFMLFVDACLASTAEPAVNRWTNMKGRRPFLWVGSSQQSEAFNGCFTRTVARMLSSGLAASDHPDNVIPSRLGASEVMHVVEQHCESRTAGKLNPPHTLDAYIALNRARSAQDDQLGFRSATARRFTSLVDSAYQPNGFEDVRAAFDASEFNFVVVVGGPGSGKTRLLCTLRDPPAAAPVRALDAIVFLEPNSTRDDMAAELHPQLMKSPSYRDAVRLHRLGNPDYARLPSFEQFLTGPLETLIDKTLVLGIDGLDQVDEARETIIGALCELAEHHSGCVRILATSRPGVRLPPRSERLAMPVLDADLAEQYLVKRNLDAERAKGVLSQVGGDLNWLALEAAADQATFEEELVGLSELYDEVHGPSTQVDVDGAVALAAALLVAAGQVAGVGPVIPYVVFKRALAGLDGPVLNSQVTDILSSPLLRQVVVRHHPSTPDDHLGLFHRTAVHELGGRVGQQATGRAHSAIATAIENLKPHIADGQGLIRDYGRRFQPEHLFESGRFEEIPDAVRAWVDYAPSPSDQYRQEEALYQKVAARLGDNHLTSVNLRLLVGFWAGEVGFHDAAETVMVAMRPLIQKFGERTPISLRIRLFDFILRIRRANPPQLEAIESLKEALQAVCGDSHEDTLLAELFVITLTDFGETYEPAAYLAKASRRSSLWKLTSEVWGEFHPLALELAQQCASDQYEMGHIEQSVADSRAILARRCLVLGVDHYDVLDHRMWLAERFAETGDLEAATEVAASVLSVLESAFDSHSGNVLEVRALLARWSDQQRGIYFARPAITREVLGVFNGRDTILLGVLMASATDALEAEENELARDVFAAIKQPALRTFGEGHHYVSDVQGALDWLPQRWESLDDWYRRSG